MNPLSPFEEDDIRISNFSKMPFKRYGYMAVSITACEISGKMGWNYLAQHYSLRKTINAVTPEPESLANQKMRRAAVNDC